MKLFPKTYCFQGKKIYLRRSPGHVHECVRAWRTAWAEHHERAGYDFVFFVGLENPTKLYIFHETAYNEGQDPWARRPNGVGVSNLLHPTHFGRPRSVLLRFCLSLVGQPRSASHDLRPGTTDLTGTPCTNALNPGPKRRPVGSL